MLLVNTLHFPATDWVSGVIATTDILIKPVKTMYSTSKSSTIRSYRLGIDIEEG